MKKKFGIKGGVGHHPMSKPKVKKPKQPKGPGNPMANFVKKWDPNAPLRGKDLLRELNASTRLEFNPLERQLQSEYMASQDRVNREIPAWFQGYQDKLAALRGESQAAYDQAGSAIQANMNQQASQDTASQAAIMDRLQKDAQLRGTSVDPNIDISQAGAQAARQASSGSRYATLQTQGANQYAYLTNRQALTPIAAREAAGEELARSRKITADQREIASKKGDYMTDFLRQARENERKYILEGRAAGLDKFKAKESARHNRASEAETARGHSITARGQNISSRDRREALRKQNIRDRKNRRQDARQHRQDKKSKKKGGVKL